MYKNIPKFEHYLITTSGEVINTITKQKRKLSVNHNGYLFIKLHNKGKQIQPKIHRLVADAFIPNLENKPFVNHINGIKTDNRVENLEWCTSSENIQHALKLGLIVRKFGENATGSKLSKKNVLFIFKNKGVLTNKELAIKFKVTTSNINLIQNGKSRFDDVKSEFTKLEINNIFSKKTLIIKTYKEIYEIKDNKIIKIWKSTMDIAKEYNLNKSSISEVARGTKKSIYGKKFMYKEKFTNEAALNRDLESERTELEK